MAQILDTQGLQHYANKMCNADNRKVGSKSLPTALNDIDTAIDGFKTLFETEYSAPINTEFVNSENMFSIGTGSNIDKRDDVENSFTDLKVGGNSLVNLNTNNRNDLFGTSGDGSGYSKSFNEDSTICTYKTVTKPVSSYVTIRMNVKEKLKKNTKYTLIFNILENNISNLQKGISIRGASDPYCSFTSNSAYYILFSDSNFDNAPGKKIISFTTGNNVNEYTGFGFGFPSIYNSQANLTFKIGNIILLEGDWADKYSPEYFNGMLSVGEKANSIKLLSQMNKPNLMRTGFSIPSAKASSWGAAGSQCTSVLVTDSTVPNGQYMKFTMTQTGQGGIYAYPISRLEKGKKYTWSVYVKCSSNKVIHIGSEQSGNLDKNITTAWTRLSHTFTATARASWAFVFYLKNSAIGDEVSIHSLKIEEGDLSAWCPNNEEILNNIGTEKLKYETNKIELSEPLRGLPNGIKDTIEKINDEWKIIRRCKQDILTGNSITGFASGAAGTSIGENVNRIEFLLNNAKWNENKDKTMLVCDKFSFLNFHATGNGSIERNSEAICFHSNNAKNINLHILKTRLSEQNITVARSWLNSNPIKIVYELENYIIEDIDPVTLQCWKNGTISIVDEIIPVETTHTVALNKSAQIQKNIEELTSLRNRVKTLEEQYSKTSLNQAYETELLKLDMKLDNII